MTFRFEDQSRRGQAGGYASLDSGGHVPAGQLPAGIVSLAPIGTFSADVAPWSEPGFLEPAHLDGSGGWLIFDTDGEGEIVAGYGTTSQNSIGFYASAGTSHLFGGQDGGGEIHAEVHASSTGAKISTIARPAQTGPLFELVDGGVSRGTMFKVVQDADQTFTDVWVYPAGNGGGTNNRIEIFAAHEGENYAEQMIQLVTGGAESLSAAISIDSYVDENDATQNYAQITLRSPTITGGLTGLPIELWSDQANTYVHVRALNGQAIPAFVVSDHSAVEKFAVDPGGAVRAQSISGGTDTDFTAHADGTGFLHLLSGGGMQIQDASGSQMTIQKTSGGTMLIDPGVDGLLLSNIPSSDPHVAGQVWNLAGALMMSAG